jgi:hypothetical protein
MEGEKERREDFRLLKFGTTLAEALRFGEAS